VAVVEDESGGRVLAVVDVDGVVLLVAVGDE
jgi:hypothetical protein